jgi:protein O-GlcNAc transferase
MQKTVGPRPQLQAPAAAALQAKVKKAVAFHQQGNLAEAERIYREILQRLPNHFDALHLLGVIAGQTRRPELAVELIGKAIGVDAKVAAAHRNRGNALRDLKRFEEALASYDRAIALKPDHAEAYSNRGNVLVHLKRLEEALASYDKALMIRPDFTEVLNNRGNVLAELKHLEEALASYDKALMIRPDFTEVLNNRGNVLAELKGPAEALASYDSALAIKPDDAGALYNRGNALRDLKRFEEALASYDRAIALKPDYAEAYSNRGNVLVHLKRPEEALASHDRAIALKPDYAEAYNNRGSVLRDLKRLEEALASYDKALTVKSDFAAALNNRGNALRDLTRPEEALASYDSALAIKPDDAGALYNRGNALDDLKRLEEAIASYEKALALRPDYDDAFIGVAVSVNRICDWTRRKAMAGQVRDRIASSKSVLSPLVALSYLNDQALLRQCAENFIKNKIGNFPFPLWRGEVWHNERIKIAYLSADFRRHAVAYLMAELFERHDRARFEIIGVSFSPDDRSEMRARLVAAFDQFFDVREKSDAEVARLLCELKVDIAVDLQGYTRNCRARILAHRPAPIQVNYLGFSGTMGADFIDYVIADKVVLPFDQQPFYSERIVHLPDCYQPNDRRRQIAERTPARAELGLPEQGFVFCSFNNNWKITPEAFDVWMRLLKAIDGSVLWLRADTTAEQNLSKEAAARGVDPARLVFAPRMKRLEDHLARHRLADLFLDTLPYNAHTTASDALWAGLPVLTCMGNTFAGRVAASLLHAIGLPELVTNNLPDYEALALTLARDPARLREIKAKLARNRDTDPLFDTDRFRRGIEAAYGKMWEIWQTGEKPTSFSVSVLP